MSINAFDGCKVFSATMFRQREELGDVVVEWLRKRDDIETTDVVVRQSSDSHFHCITIIVFWKFKRELVVITPSADGESQLVQKFDRVGENVVAVKSVEIRPTKARKAR